jgi:hypothetical protein
MARLQQFDEMKRKHGFAFSGATRYPEHGGFGGSSFPKLVAVYEPAECVLGLTTFAGLE